MQLQRDGEGEEGRGGREVGMKYSSLVRTFTKRGKNYKLIKKLICLTLV